MQQALANKAVLLATWACLLVAACGEQPTAESPRMRSSLVSAPGGAGTNQTQYWCETHPEECGTEGPSDPDPSAPGYWMGTTMTPSTCFSATGTNINDVDYDGTHDYCERRLAERFRPGLALAGGNIDCDPTGEPYWAAKYFPGSIKVMRIAYLPAYHRDCGNTGVGSFILDALFTVITFNGLYEFEELGVRVSTDDPGEGHTGDSEFIIVDLKYNETSEHWYVYGAFLSSHFLTAADGSRQVYTTDLEYPEEYGGYPRVWIAPNKHANYATRHDCNTRSHDNCDANVFPTVVRMEFHTDRNVGSVQANAINAGTCVPSEQPQFYPGTECFWERDNSFNGWLTHLYGHPGTAYRSFLVMKFECYSLFIVSSHEVTCSSSGVNRLQ